MEDRPGTRSEPIDPLHEQVPHTNLVWTALPVQIVLTGFVTFIVIALLSVVGGTFTEGLQVIAIAVFSTPLTIAAFVLGLPLRLLPRARFWWFRHTGWAVALLGLSVTVLFLSYFVGGATPVHYDATAAWPASDGYMPDVPLFLAALSVLALASMHLLPPRHARRAAVATRTRLV